jgi:hypothetical protein
MIWFLDGMRMLEGTFGAEYVVAGRVCRSPCKLAWAGRAVLDELASELEKESNAPMKSRLLRLLGAMVESCRVLVLLCLW